MLARIADLTWRRPKLVLALVGVFIVLAGAVGHDVEHHLKAAGFTDSASESEQRDASCCARSSATTRTRASSCSSDRRAAGGSTSRAPRSGARSTGSPRELAPDAGTSAASTTRSASRRGAQR